jgi:hypothetical protein
MLEIRLYKRMSFSYTECSTKENVLLFSVTYMINLPLRTEEFKIGKFINNTLTTKEIKCFKYY